MLQTNTDMTKKELAIQRKLNGESVAAISADMDIPRSTLYSWLSKSGDETASKKPRTERQELAHIKESNAKLEGMVDLLKTAFDVKQLPLERRLKVIEQYYNEEKYSVHLMCDTLEVPRGTFYNYIFRGKKGDTMAARRREEMKKKVEQVYHDSNQIYGAQKIHAVLKEQGEVVSVEFVRELMREMGLQMVLRSVTMTRHANARTL